MSLVLLLAAAMSTPIQPPDPLKTDPDKYSLVLENARVRVLRYHDRPGQKTSMHAHPDLVLHWVDAQMHIGENIGHTDTDVMIVELKEPRPNAAR